MAEGTGVAEYAGAYGEADADDKANSYGVQFDRNKRKHGTYDGGS